MDSQHEFHKLISGVSPIHFLARKSQNASPAVKGRRVSTSLAALRPTRRAYLGLVGEPGMIANSDRASSLCRRQRKARYRKVSAGGVLLHRRRGQRRVAFQVGQVWPAVVMRLFSSSGVAPTPHSSSESAHEVPQEELRIIIGDRGA